MEENKSLFDFDGTLIRINSFPYWILFVIGYSILSFNFKLSSKVLKLLIQRKIKHKISHREFKKRLIELPISYNCNLKFAKFLSFFVRKELIIEVQKLYELKHEIAISSAAPEIYLIKSIELLFPKIHQNLLILGSKLNLEKELVDNFKDEKLKNLYEIQFLKEHETLKNLYTDSWDDAALAFHSENIYLIAPKKDSENKYLSNPKLVSKIRKL